MLRPWSGLANKLRSKLLLPLRLPSSQDQDVNHFCPEPFQITFAPAVSGTCRATWLFCVQIQHQMAAFCTIWVQSWSREVSSTLWLGQICPSVLLHNSKPFPSTLHITVGFLFYFLWLPDWNSFPPLDFEFYQNKTVSVANQNFIPVQWLSHSSYWTFCEWVNLTFKSPPCSVGWLCLNLFCRLFLAAQT